MLRTEKQKIAQDMDRRERSHFIHNRASHAAMLTKTHLP